MALPPLQGFSEITRQYLQRLPVLRDGTACHHHTLLPQYARNLRIAQRLARIFSTDKLFDQCTYRGAGRGTACVGTDMTAEKKLELKYAPRRTHELVSRDT